jgi:hypothetical protein
VVIDAVHPVTIIEEQRLRLLTIAKETLEAAVQACRKVGIVLVEVDYVRWPVGVNRVPSLPQMRNSSGLMEVLAREREANVSSLIAEWHTIRE